MTGNNGNRNHDPYNSEKRKAHMWNEINNDTMMISDVK